VKTLLAREAIQGAGKALIEDWKAVTRVYRFLWTTFTGGPVG